MDNELKPILFSVVIPTYNHANFLKIALQSVIDQDYESWEAIVVDNNSSDNTKENGMHPLVVFFPTQTKSGLISSHSKLNNLPLLPIPQ